MARAPSGHHAGARMMMRAAALTPCNSLSGTCISHKVTSEWETRADRPGSG